MFRWINNQGVESEKGFIVQSMNRNTIVYREGPKTITVYVERGAIRDGKRAIDIAPNSFARWDGETAELSRNEQDRILSNFVSAIEFQGQRVDLDPEMQRSPEKEREGDFDLNSATVLRTTKKDGTLIDETGKQWYPK